MSKKKPFTDLGFRGTTWYLASEVDQKLEAIKTHLESYPDEKDDETYSIERHYPSTAGPRIFNSVLFLTHLETWHKQLREILEEAEG